MLTQLLNKKFKKVLVCPLDWGLGHASRLIIIIEKLLDHNFEIIIAADKEPLELLKKEFPKLNAIVLKGARVKYSHSNRQLWSILKFLPSFAQSINHEHIELYKIIEEQQVDVVISDNRYGLWNKSIYSILITHQLKLKLPPFFAFAEGLTKYLIYHLAKNFNEVWVPDYEDSKYNLSGELSHFNTKFDNKLKYIGILSKFQSEFFKTKNTHNYENKHQIAVILSGPEPQRTVLELILLKELKNLDIEVKLVLGKKNYKPKTEYKSNIKFISFAGKEELYEIIQGSEFIICRAGYSSIMDLVVLNKKAILIPTPGQTEQEYLANYLSGNKLFYCLKQEELKIERVLSRIISKF